MSAAPDTAARPLRSRALLAAIAGLVLLGAAAYLGAWIWPQLFVSPTITAPLPQDCDLRLGPCTARFPAGQAVRLAIAPRDLPPMQPLQLEVWVDGITAQQVEVDFQGVTMNMGLNRNPLSAAGHGEFTGRAVLPVCIRGRMEWEAQVTVDTGNATWVAPFRFTVESR